MAETVVCRMEGKAADHFEKVTNAEPGAALIFKCSRKDAKIIVDDYFDSISPGDLAEELAGDNRLVIYRCGWKLPDQSNRAAPANLLVWFNPVESSDISIKRTYYPTMMDLLQKYPMLFKREYQINNVADFSEDWLKKQNYLLHFDSDLK
uniref:ADF-H domain-containing protein n=1 Tax=Paramoeba aestuarina TaxID=180227 RepID=A0A7S4KM43_9EUKA|mmetsp:Transcript_2153/g.3370  ORF Transcript_2153/g.3370 Transcript_2153/m.3370 type:complete len:150 (+) Transcript_2153:52-501(+)|eukprot:CAMPEP_0201523558 /NCGR_PEP_ID=MMETSP0161_2-20130828/20288_1 /ASSEMBLY_ACC=CAM_ASM_000251 /TAXON_ID=180227 /ORGANISM="Neoparamoeba aestuarina, Strain SoJaBio B1-5/56/2" /LENGTH=149 /DNA_ID=CAMNT_0047922715 /DNA_START=56 /DNA_END=505 /DNA_ORIENTATION=-